MEKVEIESFTLDHTKILYQILMFAYVNRIDKRFQPELCIL